MILVYKLINYYASAKIKESRIKTQEHRSKIKDPRANN